MTEPWEQQYAEAVQEYLCVNFCPKHPGGEFFIVSFCALISHKKFQHDSLTPSWSKFEIEFTIGITIGNEPKNISDGPSANLRPLFNIKVPKVSVLKWSQN